MRSFAVVGQSAIPCSLIDWMQVLNYRQESQADKFAAALFQIGSNQLAFDPEKAVYLKEIRNSQNNNATDALKIGSE